MKYFVLFLTAHGQVSAEGGEGLFDSIESARAYISQQGYEPKYCAIFPIRITVK